VLFRSLGHNISVLGMLVESVGDSSSTFARQFVCLVPLMYICWCTYLSVFRVKLFGVLELSGNKQTDAYSLLFNASFMCRLQFSLAYNFLDILHISPQTAYERSVGKHMDLIPAINTYMPLMLVAIVGLVICNAFEKFMGLLGIDVKGSPVKGNVEDEEKIREGRALIRRARQGSGPGPSGSGASSRHLVSDAPGSGRADSRTPARPVSLDENPNHAKGKLYRPPVVPTTPVPSRVPTRGALDAFVTSGSVFGSSSSAPRGYSRVPPDV